MTLSSSADALSLSLQRVATSEFTGLRPQALLGLFDSGLGGLTVLRRLLSQRPGQPCLYVGDTARVPYGSRDRAEIRSIAAEVVGWLRQQGAEAVVMACNTTNALALDVAQSEAGVPVLGLIDSVARQVKQQRIGVLATDATAASGAYGRALQAQRHGLTIVEMGCPAFVPAVEAHQLDTPQLRQAAQRYLEPLLEARVEAIVLGCSHYPLLEPMLRELLPADVELIDPAANSTGSPVATTRQALRSGPVAGWRWSGKSDRVRSTRAWAGSISSTLAGSSSRSMGSSSG